MFSGTIFARGTTGYSVTQIPWDKQARYELPVGVWRALMDQHFPGGGWLRLDRETLDSLGHYKSVRGLTSWEEAVAALLTEAGQVTS